MQTETEIASDTAAPARGRWLAASIAAVVLYPIAALGGPLALIPLVAFMAFWVTYLRDGSRNSGAARGRISWTIALLGLLPYLAALLLGTFLFAIGASDHGCEGVCPSPAMRISLVMLVAWPMLWAIGLSTGIGVWRRPGILWLVVPVTSLALGLAGIYAVGAAVDLGRRAGIVDSESVTVVLDGSRDTATITFTASTSDVPSGDAYDLELSFSLGGNAASERVPMIVAKIEDPSAEPDRLMRNAWVCEGDGCLGTWTVSLRGLERSAGQLTAQVDLYLDWLDRQEAPSEAAVDVVIDDVA